MAPHQVTVNLALVCPVKMGTRWTALAAPEHHRAVRCRLAIGYRLAQPPVLLDSMGRAAVAAAGVAEVILARIPMELGEAEAAPADSEPPLPESPARVAEQASVFLSCKARLRSKQ